MPEVKLSAFVSGRLSTDIHEKYISVVFTLLGTTQGLALSALGAKIPEVSSFGYDIATFSVLSSLSVCFFVIARVTQTYISAAVGYVHKSFGIVDLLSILFVGLMQGWLIQSIDGNCVEANYLHLKVMILAAIAVFLHGFTLYNECKHNDVAPNFDLQVFNCLIVGLIGLFALWGFFTNDDYVSSIVSCTISLFLLLNIVNSLRHTDFTGEGVVLIP